ncbi:MAG: glutamine synthetase III [Deltaproteobacteria bacterium]|jgi:glutamine synthetase|nr:glutamine synthetase III [Deltaproteobacteria bacterium]
MSDSPRKLVKAALAGEKHHPAECRPYSPAAIFEKDVFSLKTMRERLPKNVYFRIEEAVKKGVGLLEGDADIVASAMKDWAIEQGATHYTHWFQPMTGTTAEKHDAFITPDPGHKADGRLINEFSGKMLIKGESDASSLPSGGIRSTFEARGYTAWDPTSPAFLMENALGKTLYVPSIFLSYTGESLDRKTPLLRSNAAVSRQSLRILRLFGNNTATHVDVMVGAEQEYFLVDRRLAALRDDLRLARRTLFGAKSSKGQELEDHYFGAIGRRVLNFMAEVEKRMFALGIPARTRHNESAPAQFELAPMYETANLATDHNMLTMEILHKTAEFHGFSCLLHEKPFAGVNGSGKHNNWSLCDSEGNNLLDPGNTPLDNAQFLVFLAAVLRAVHLHPVVLRLGAVGAGNDHRLGASEAPPAILSIFLGDQLTNIISSIAEGKNNGRGEASGWQSGHMRVGISSLPQLPKDISDRNRTSPFAFTGNKFEYRAVGASMSIAPVNIAINTAVACALDDIATELEAAIAGGQPLAGAVQSLLGRLFKEHLPIIFNGNGYSEEWHREAARRGLPNYKDSVNVLAHYSDPVVMDAFVRQGVFSERELLARQDILLENYIRDLHLETKLMLSMGRTMILPVALRWLEQAGNLARLASELIPLNQAGLPSQPDGQTAPVGARLPELDYYNKIRGHAFGLVEALDRLDSRHEDLDRMSGTLVRAEAARDVLIPLMNACRAHADALELLVDDALWPLPKYNELLWNR